MARRMLLLDHDGSAADLEQVSAESEAQLQELFKAHPDLLSAEDLGLSPPLLVVGRETSLPSGAIDLILLARSGDVIVVEFKTGPQNSDFRKALAQLVDYGSDLWKLSYVDFEKQVPLRYFRSDHCEEADLRDCQSLEDAARMTWPDLTEEDFAALRERLSGQLADGSLHYVLLAQDFRDETLRSLEYMNETSISSYYAVEVIRFAGSDREAFEARAVLRPSKKRTATPQALEKSEFLGKFDGADHRDSVELLIDEATSLGYRIHWGTVGISVRVPVPDRSEPVTVCWINPPEVQGWLGLTDVTIGCDPNTLRVVPLAAPALETFARKAEELEGAVSEHRGPLIASHLSPAAVVQNRSAIAERLRGLIEALREDG